MRRLQPDRSPPRSRSNATLKRTFRLGAGGDDLVTTADCLPAALVAERMILGSVVLDAHLLAEVRPALEVSEFSIEPHRRIWSAITALYDSGISRVDRVMVYYELQKRNQAESVGGLSYLSELDANIPRLANIGGYVEIVKEKAFLR